MTWFELHNLSGVEPKCTLTLNKPLPVTEGAALGGQGLCQTRRRVEAKGGSDSGGVGWGWKRRAAGCILYSHCFSSRKKKDQIIQRKQTLS